MMMADEIYTTLEDLVMDVTVSQSRSQMMGGCNSARITRQPPILSIYKEDKDEWIDWNTHNEIN
jgi:hypothetical protein